MGDVDIDLSLEGIRRRLRRGFNPPGRLEFQELCLTPDIILAYGGDGDLPPDRTSTTTPLAPCMQQQVESLHIRGLEELQERIQQDSGNLLVCLETALPCEPRPSIGFVAATWFAKHVSEHGVDTVKEGSLDRKPGSLAEVLALLAVLDFLTACDAGYSSTATRVVTLKAAQQECLAKAELQLIFGVPDADPVRTTAVMRLLQSQGAAAEEALFEALLQMLPKQASRDEAQELREPVQLLLAAAQCLSLVSEAEAEETARMALAILRLRPTTASVDELQEAFGDAGPLDYLGVELYRSAVNCILACFSSWTGYFAFDDLQLHDIKASLTVLETSAAPCYQSPLGENQLPLAGCPHASCAHELRRHIGQRLLEHRFERLHGQALDQGDPPDHAKERSWNRLFDTVDTDHNGRISMEEWWKALEDDCNQELRALFQFESRKMKKLLQKLFKSSIHREAESSVSRDDFLLACRMAERDELLWHFVYMVAGHEAESADDRSGSKGGEDPLASIVKWNRRNIEVGLQKEHGIFETYSRHFGVWQRLAQSKIQAWQKHCRTMQRRLEEIEEAKHGHEFVYLPGCDEMEEVFRCEFSEQLFVKVAFSTSKSRQDVAIFQQLVLLQCHVLEAVWKSLFPKRCQQATPELVEQCPELWLGIDYVFSKKPSVAHFSAQGFEKWRKSEKWREIGDERWSCDKTERQELLQQACYASSPAVMQAQPLPGLPTCFGAELPCKGLREAMKEYIHLCRAGAAGNKQEGGDPYQLRLLKHILGFLNMIEGPLEPLATATACALQAQEGARPQPGIAPSLLQCFASVLLEVVERHGQVLQNQEETAVKDYLLSQDWRPEEMRYALRSLTCVLAYESNLVDAQTTVAKRSPTAIQAALGGQVAGLTEVIRIYGKFLACLEEKDLSRGIYRPCSVLQNLLLVLQGIQSKPCIATLPAWLAGTDFLHHLGRLLEHGAYRRPHGHAVALVFQVATQMTCKAYVARMDFPQHGEKICENISKLMKVMLMWSSINRQGCYANWSKPLQEAINTSLPEFVDLLAQLLPAAQASSPLERLKKWTRTPSDNIRVKYDLMSSPMPRPVPAFCKCEA